MSSKPLIPLRSFKMVNDNLGPGTHARIIEAACICTLGALLVAGLWPFHVPKNDVSWVVQGDGLYFGNHGAIISASSFLPQPDKASGTIEIWLEPSLLRGDHTILSFDGSAHSGVPFSLRQINDALIVEQDNEDMNGHSWTAWSVVNGAFRRGKPVFASIVLAPRHTTVYIDGVFSRDFSIGDSWNNLTGRLVIANSPSSNDSWSGKIKGMAIYNRQLTEGEVLEHYESWTKTSRPDYTHDQAPLALYRFNEHAGDTAHNTFNPGIDLKIPTRYFVLHSACLESIWRSYHPSWSYWEDVTLNVVGFIPFGFFATAYFSSVRQLRGAAAITVVLGFLISLAIEVLQAFLPTRDSSMSDLITNTLGTAGGAVLYPLLVRSKWLGVQSEAAIH